MNSKLPLWGIDLGGTKIEGVIMPSLDSAEPLIRIRVDTEAGKGYRHIQTQIQKLIEEMKEKSGLVPVRIGIGTPGELDPVTQKMKNGNTTALNGQPLQRDLAKLLGIEVILGNDANCFALAETHWGIAKEKYPQARMVFGVIMGTGVGGGIVIDGKVWNGHHGIGGEWGHVFLDESGGPCYCGKTGCVETVISGPALERYYTSHSGKELKLHDIISAAATHDAAADTVQRLHYYFGKALSIITNLLDPDLIIIGGGLGNIDSLYTEGVASLRHFIFNPTLEVPVVKPQLGDSAGVFGAAALCQ